MTSQAAEDRDAIVHAALAHVPFDGWSKQALRAGAVDAGFAAERADQVFAGGPVQAVVHFCDLADRLMLQDLEAAGLDQLRIREKIATAVRLRLSRWAPHREAIRKATGVLMRPSAAAASTKTLYNTVHAMWRAAGDRSTDYNFYTKRALLAGVYSSTLLVWLDDKSEDFQDSWAFLDRRIENVMSIEKAKAKAKDAMAKLPNGGRMLDLLKPRFPRPQR